MAHLAPALHVVGALRDGLRLRGNVEPRPERRVDALLEVEGQIPRCDVLEQMREMHVRAVREVAVGAEVGVAERLEVRDLRRPEPRLLRRREAEEELGSVRDEVGALGFAAASAICFGQPRSPPSNPPPTNPFRMLVTSEQAAEIVEDRRRTLPRCGRGRRCGATTATSFCSSRVVSGSLGNLIASSSTRTGLPRLRRTAVERKMPLGLRGNEALEVRKPPGHRHAEAGGRGLEALVEPPECVLELRAGLPQLDRAARPRAQSP